MSKNYTVSELNLEIKDIIERSIPGLSVEGEISNYKPHYSGHVYLTLKDDESQISVVMWKSQALRLGIELEDGKKVICHGNISVYEKAGRYQLIARDIEELGKGDLQKRFEELKNKLFDKGYFDTIHKKTIPKYPQTIGIISSPAGAAIQDVVSVAERRNSRVQLILRPAKVQGENAAIDLVNAIKEFNTSKEKIDLIILTRGGGSLEDLWAFNEERLAEEIFNSRIPVISAVGHEIDYSISDFVADLRAATPSAAAEIAVPKRDDLLSHIAYLEERSRSLLERQLNSGKEKIERLKSHYALNKIEYVLKEKQQRISELKDLTDINFLNIIKEKKNKLQQLNLSLNALNPSAVLERGYSIIRQKGKLIDSVDKLKDGPANIQFSDGELEKEIKSL